MKAEEEAKNALERARKNHAQMKENIEQQKTINENYQRQVEALQREKTNLQSNVSALGETKTVFISYNKLYFICELRILKNLLFLPGGTCGRCLSGWSLLNSSCYFFSYTESSTVKKNWHDSRADCVSRGADLVVIDNPEEQVG